MDRLNIKCMIAGREVNLQLDKKAMPGETGPCYMITEEGCFKGYIAKQQKGTFKQLGLVFYSKEDLQTISHSIDNVQSSFVELT